jgi:glycerophosphoryl diester phosphodiesterase
VKLLGHRGASAEAPENTIEAFAMAMTQGAAGVELDVMRARSGELVVCHDERLTRLAGVDWLVAEKNWRDLKHLDVGSLLGFRPAKIPLLHEVFDALPAGAVVNVELKCDDFDDRGLSEAVARLLVDRSLHQRVFVSSFNPLNLVRVAASAPMLKRGFLIDPDKAWWPQAHLWAPVVATTSVHPHFSQVTQRRCNLWHQRGWQVATWTVDDVDEAKRMRALGVQWLITNRPGVLAKGL